MNDIIATILLLLIPVSIIAYMVIRTRTDFTWGEVIGFLIVIELPIGLLVFGLLLQVSVIIALVWAVIAPFALEFVFAIVVYIIDSIRSLIADKLQNKDRIEKSSAARQDPPIILTTNTPTESKSIHKEVLPAFVSISTDAETIVSSSSFEVSDQTDVILKRCLCCGAALSDESIKCSVCGFDHTKVPIHLLIKTDSFD